MKNKKQILDPAFLRNNKYSYVDYDDDSLASILCFALAHHNADLILHQQRIELYKQKNKQNLLYSSLVDLFIALGDKGLSYRERMLNKYCDYLSKNQTVKLTQALNKIITPESYDLNLNQSILNLGNKGGLLSSELVS